MRLVIIDSEPHTRSALMGRTQEAMRQADIKRPDIVEVEVSDIPLFDWSTASGCIIGPGCFESLEEVVEKVRISFGNGYIGAVLESDDYSQEGVNLRKKLNVIIISLADLGQLAGFLLECETKGGGKVRNEGIIAIGQLKGGVGCTTVTAALASCYAHHGLTVAAIDLDDVNPQLTAWARVGVVQRAVTSEFLRRGEIPDGRLNELLHPVEGFDGRLVVVGQPEAYNESFQFKASVLDGAPPASDFVSALLERLQAEFDVVLVDLGKSWGVSTFATLPRAQAVLLVTDDDGMSVRRTLDALSRLKKESDDTEEFDLSKWSLVLNAYTGKLLSPKDLADEVKSLGIFPEEATLYTIPFSETGRQWGAPGRTLYDMTDPANQDVIKKVAHSLVPFRFDTKELNLTGKLLKRFQSLVNS